MMQGVGSDSLSPPDIERADQLNERFYSRFLYPWPAAAFHRLTDPRFETTMLNQSIGSWDQRALPAIETVWVAGCGTNQAVITALRFPDADVLGTDLSVASLRSSADTARQLHLSNLRLRAESINEVSYEACFDHVICTGVVHHNADPQATMARLARALKPSGIIELMVFNRYHRVAASAVQDALRVLAPESRDGREDARLALARRLVAGIAVDNAVESYLDTVRDFPEPRMADELLQPIEHHFTVRSLSALAESCGLELIAPCVNQFDASRETFTWDIGFADAELQRTCEALPDLDRWQIGNLLLLERSPMLWFYLGRQDGGQTRPSEREICAAFLETAFQPSRTEQEVYLRQDDGRYSLQSGRLPYPRLHANGTCRSIVDACSGPKPPVMRQILHQVGVDTRLSMVNKLRAWLTTGVFPYLTALP